MCSNCFMGYLQNNAIDSIKQYSSQYGPSFPKVSGKPMALWVTLHKTRPNFGTKDDLFWYQFIHDPGNNSINLRTYIDLQF
jgi:hypothetical protein